MKRKLDGKFTLEVRDGKIEIVNPAGVPIPDDEPVFLLRARDRLAMRLLAYYATLSRADSCTEYHLRGINGAIIAFDEFRSAHPERMKQPGITEGR